MSFFENIVQLTRAKSQGSSGSFVGHCPIHDDRNPSLVISRSLDGKILIYCHAKCDNRLIIDYLKQHNAWPLSNNESYNDIKYDKKTYAQSLWDSSHKLNTSDIASQYLNNRMLKVKNYPDSLRFNPNCVYKPKENESDVNKSYPALIAKIQNKEKELIGVQRIYLNEAGLKADVIDQKKVLGSFSDGYVELKADSHSDVIHLTEGIETGLAIFLSINETVYCAVSASNLSKVRTDETVKTIHIWVDNDKSGTGEKAAIDAANSFSEKGINVILHIIEDEIPPEKKGLDWLDVFQINGITAIKEELLKGKLFSSKHSNNQNPDDLFLKPIQQIKSPNYDLPKIDESYLPTMLIEWVFNHANRINVAPEMIIVPLFSIIGALIGRKLAIQPKIYDYWKVHPILWGLIIAPPGTRKTAILETSIKLLNKIEIEEAKKFEEDIVKNSEQTNELEIKIESLDKKIKEAILKDDTEKKKIAINEKSELTAKLNALSVYPKRLSTNSFSLEKLIDLLEKNSNGLLIFRDEINAIIESFKKKGQENTRQFFLEGWNGDGHFNYDVLSRVTKPIQGVAITLLGGTQPSVLNKILCEMKQDQTNDGFIQRFQLTVYPNQDIEPRFVDVKSDRKLDDRLKELFEKVINLDPFRFGENDSYSNLCITKLSPEAYALFAQYMDKNEKEVFECENDSYKNHINKFGKLLLGLILIFHVIENIETKISNSFVKLTVVQMAVKWCDLFKRHAKKLYDTEFNFETISGFSLAKKIAEGKIKNGDSIRKIYRNEWSNLQSAAQVESAAMFLEKHGWLKLNEAKPTLGRPTNCLYFNPKLQDFLKNENWQE